MSASEIKVSVQVGYMGSLLIAPVPRLEAHALMPITPPFDIGSSARDDSTRDRGLSAELGKLLPKDRLYGIALAASVRTCGVADSRLDDLASAFSQHSLITQSGISNQREVVTSSRNP